MHIFVGGMLGLVYCVFVSSDVAVNYRIVRGCWFYILSGS